MKKTIEFLGRPLFVIITWCLLVGISWIILEACQLTTNIFLLAALIFILYFGSMAFGFFYFQAFPLHRLPLCYYQKKGFETELFYILLGVKLFRRFLIKSPFRRLNQRVYLKGRKADISEFFEETKRSETSHLIGLTIGLLFILYFITQDNFKQGVLAFFFNTVMNAYPIFLQRYNRNLRIKIRD